MTRSQAKRGARSVTPKDDRPFSVQGSGVAESPQDSFDTESTEIGDMRVLTILSTARTAGLLDQKTARISGRISPALIALAKNQTGIESDTDLIEFALANVALDDGFAEAFRQARGTVDPDLPLGFE